MKRSLIAGALGLALLLSACNSNPASEEAEPEQASEAFTVVDELEREVEFDAPAERAVAVFSSDVETINALGKLDALVGTDTNSPLRWPSLGLEDLPIVAENMISLNYEAIVETQADVLFLSKLGPVEEAAEALGEFGIEVVAVSGWDFLRYEDNITTIAQVLGVEERGQEIVDFYDRTLAEISGRLEGISEEDRKRVYFEAEPYQAFLPGSGYQDAVIAAGGVGVFDDLEVTTDSTVVPRAEVSAEEIVERDPDIFLLFYTDDITELEPAASTDDIDAYADYQQRPELASSTAAQAGNVVLINGTQYNYAQKLLWVPFIAKWLYPDEFSDYDPQDALDEWLEIQGGADVPPGDDYAIFTDLS